MVQSSKSFITSVRTVKSLYYDCNRDTRIQIDCHARKIRKEEKSTIFNIICSDTGFKNKILSKTDLIDVAKLIIVDSNKSRVEYSIVRTILIDGDVTSLL